MLQTRDGCTRVYRRRNQRFARNCVLEVDNCGGGNVMMGGAISYARKTQLVHIPGNLSTAPCIDEVLTPHMLPAMNLRRDVFQHDNAWPHRARATVDFLTNQNVRVFPGLISRFEPNRTFVGGFGSTRAQSLTRAATSARTTAGS